MRIKQALLVKDQRKIEKNSTRVVSRNKATWQAEIYKDNCDIPFAKVEVNSTQKLFDRAVNE